MRALYQNKSLAGQSWSAPTSLRKYDVDQFGIVSIFADNPVNETKDTSEALAAGFVPYDTSLRIAMRNAAYGKRRVPQPDGHDVKMVDVAPREWIAAETDHHYHADDAGRIDVLEIDVDEAKAAGFVEI